MKGEKCKKRPKRKYRILLTPLYSSLHYFPAWLRYISRVQKEKTTFGSKFKLIMGILFGFLLVCLIIYAVLVTNGIYLLSKLIIINGMGMAISTKFLWIIINLLLWGVASRFIYILMINSRGGTPNIEGVWKFYLFLNTVLFLIVFLLGYKSK